MECNKQCSYRTPYGYCSLTKCQTNLGTTYAEPSHFREEDMEGKTFTVEDASMYVKPTNGRPDVYITTKWIEDHKEQYSNLYIDEKPLVRCKDCKYWNKSVYWENEKHEKQSCRCEKNNNIMTTADDFCSRGERKD